MKAQLAVKLYDWEKVTYPSEDSAETYRHDLQPGTIEFINSPTDTGKSLMNYVCACGCGRLRSLSATTGEKLPHNWKWNGNRENPTLEPSIHCLQGCKWHGYLINGEWKSV